MLDYLDACTAFFEAELDAAQLAAGIGDDKRRALLHDLAARFAEVSFYANQMVPIAAPVPAEACLMGREIIHNQKYF